MSEKENDNILNFPSQRKSIEVEDNPILAALRAATSSIDSLPAATPSNGAPITLHIHFNGGAPQIAGGNINVGSASSTTDLTEKAGLKINDEQKRFLRVLRDEIVHTAEICGLKRHPGTVMKRMNLALGVETYHDIEQSRFDDAYKHLDAKLTALKDYERFLNQMTAYHGAIKSGLTSLSEAIGKNTDLSTALSSITSSQSLSTTSAAEFERLYLTLIADI